MIYIPLPFCILKPKATFKIQTTKRTKYLGLSNFLDHKVFFLFIGGYKSSTFKINSLLYHKIFLYNGLVFS